MATRKKQTSEAAGTIRDEILTPERVVQAAERAAEIVREHMAATKDTSQQDRARLEEIQGELANLVRQVAKLGDVPEFDAVRG